MNRYNVLRKKYTFGLTHFVRLLGFITEGIFTDTVNKSSSITFYQKQYFSFNADVQSDQISAVVQYSDRQTVQIQQ